MENNFHERAQLPENIVLMLNDFPKSSIGKIHALAGHTGNSIVQLEHLTSLTREIWAYVSSDVEQFTVLVFRTDWRSES